MRKLGYAIDEISDLGMFGHGLVLREIDWPAPEDLAIVDLIELYLEIESGTDQDQGGIVVQLIGASSGAGAAMTALDMAWAAVGILGKKVLVLNCTATPWTRPSSQDDDEDDEDDAEPTGSSVKPMSRTDDLVKVSGTEFYMADVRSWYGHNGAMAKTQEIRGHIDEFRRYFDMVLVVAPAADSDPLGAIMARHVDGNILVIEAEWTPRSSAVRLREILSRCGRPILGTVLTDRQTHIPRWLAHLL